MINEKARNPLTTRNYSAYLSKFLALTEVEDVEDITVQTVKSFKEQLLAKGLSVKTINYYLICLRLFLRYLSMNDITSLSSEKVETFNKPVDKKIELVSLDELKKFLTTEVSPASDLLVNMLFSTGLRVHELYDVRIEDIKDCKFAVLGKGGKVRITFISPVVCKMLHEFLGSRKEGFIFLNKKGEHLTVRSMQRLLVERCKKLNVSKNITPHTLRHHFATDLLVNGADLRTVQELLGHASILTTQRYTHLTNNQLENSFAKFHSKL